MISMAKASIVHRLTAAIMKASPIMLVPIRTKSTNLKKILAEKILIEREAVRKLKAEYGNEVIATVTVKMAYGGLRGFKGIICETSALDSEGGVRFRGFSIPECQKILPKVISTGEPMAEGLFWLLLTGNVPSNEEAKGLTEEWKSRKDLPPHAIKMLNNFPPNLHPMSQFSATITALDANSKFTKVYSEGIHKSMYWETTYEDAMDLIAKLPTIAAIIYQNLYRNRDRSSATPTVANGQDWVSNLCTMLGFDDPEFMELMRLFVLVYSDHGGGNVTAHATHLVGSALSNPYLSLAAGMNGLAGPLHGSAPQQASSFLKTLIQQVGIEASEEVLKTYIQELLASGKYLPGYGHTVVRETDARYVSLDQFAQKHFPNDPLYKFVTRLSKVAPEVMKETNVKSPWPNVAANTGCVLQHYGMTEMNFYAVLFGLSRALGVMASLIWDRALGHPIERIKSLTTPELKTFLHRPKKY